MPARRGGDLFFDGVSSLFDRGLPPPRRGAVFTVAQLIGDFLLALRQRRRFGQRAIQGVERLLPPRRRERIAALAQLIRQPGERIGGFLPRRSGAARVTLARGIGGFFHRALRAPRRGPRLLQRHRLAHALDTARQQI